MIMLLTVIPMLMMSMAIMGGFRRQVMARGEERVAVITQAQADRFNGMINEQRINLEMIANLPVMAEQNDEDEETRLERIRNLLAAFTGVQQSVRDMAYLDANGRALVYSAGGGAPIPATELTAIRDCAGIYVADLQRGSSGSDTVEIYYPLISQSGGVRGYLRTTLEAEGFQRILEDMDTFRTGRMAVIDGAGSVVATNNPLLGGSIENISVDNTLAEQWRDLDRSRDTSGFLHYRLNGADKLGGYAVLNGTGWTVLYSVEAREIGEPVVTAAWILAAGFLLLLAALLYIAWFSTRRFVVPLEQMSAAIREVERGDGATRIQYHKPDEYGRIAAAFNSLMDRVDENRRQLEESQRELQTVIANIPGGVYICAADEACTFHYLSEGYLRLLGADREGGELVYGNSFYQTVYPDDRERVRCQMIEQLGQGDVVEIEYRLNRHDGRILWVLDRGRLVRAPEGDAFYCVVMDITATKNAMEELRLSEERYRIIMNQVQDIVFEWNLADDSLTFSANWEERFGFHPINQQVSERMAASRRIHPDDLETFLGMMRAVRENRPYIEADFRLLKGEQGYVWCRARVTVQADEAGRPLKAVGILTDIDQQRRETEQLRDAARTDSLTGVLNKGATQERISSFLNGEGQEGTHALAIIDIDNFKHINDRLGHPFGDALLGDVASRLRGLFRQTDIVGRIGGDEFIVLMRDVTAPDFIRRKGKELVETFRQTFTSAGQKYRLTMSVGFALYPANGLNYRELYRNADHALYVAKNNGRDQYCIFDDAMRASAFISNVGEIAAEGRQRVPSRENMTEYIFRLMYEARDIEAAVQLVLRIVGSHYGVSRMYVFENSDDDRYCHNTFEWCGEGVEPQIENLKRVAYADLTYEGHTYKENFNEDGVFYCDHIETLNPVLRGMLEPQGIQSILQCALLDDGRFRGYVGFDDCSRRRLWNEEEIHTLTFISRLLGIFLLKIRDHERTTQALARNAEMLERFPSMLYIVDCKTHRLLYRNARTREHVPGAREGELCYRAFMNRDRSCDFCPMQDYLATGKPVRKEVYSAYLGDWTDCIADGVPWTDGRQACLMSCYDITQYKRQEPRPGEDGPA